jgi:predicted permease
MRLLRTAAARLKALFRRDAVAGEIREELQFHLDMRAEEYRQGGLPSDEARRAARRRFGSIALIQDRGYDVRGGGVMETILEDVRYGVRLLVTQRGFSLVAILMLALTIGLSTALFSVIEVALLRPLPYPYPEQLVRIGVETKRDGETSSGPTPSMADMRLWQSATDVLTSAAGWGSSFGGRIVDGPEPERVQVLQFTEQFLSMHGVTPLLGRDFTRQDMEPGAPPVVLLGHGYWQRRYGARPDVVGETIRLDDGTATIVGVLPARFEPTRQLSRPLRIPREEFDRRGTGRVSVWGRLRSGVTIEQARERLSALMTTKSDTERARASVFSRLGQTVAGNRTTVHVLMAAVGLILLIACVNLAGLLLARGAAREPELSVRASLGASRARLLRQLLTESAVLSIAGGLVAVLLAWLSLDILVANLPMSLPSSVPVTLNRTVLAATVLLLVLTTLLFGLMPALRLSRVGATSALARSRRQTSSSLSRRGGQILIAAEVTLAVVLVMGAGLMIRSFSRMSSVDLGFEAEGLLTMELLPLDADPEVHRAYYPGLLRQIRTIPGVTSVGVIDNFVLGGATTYSGIAVGGTKTRITVFEGLPGYFETLGAHVREGRLPDMSDYTSGRRWAVLTATAAREGFPDGSAVGRQFTGRGQSEPWTVLGVVDDLRHGGPLNTRDLGLPQVLFPYDPTSSSVDEAMVVVVRAAGAPPDLADRLRQAAQSVGPRVLVERIRTSEEWMGRLVLTLRRRTVLLGILGGFGMLLAVVGIFGITAYAVAHRTAEVGVRMAFGATPAEVVRRIVQDAAWPVLLGVVAGVCAAYYGTRWIQSFLFDTAPHDAATFVTVAALMVSAALLAAWLPARRAARVDPVVALRAE